MCLWPAAWTVIALVVLSAPATPAGKVELVYPGARALSQADADELSRLALKFVEGSNFNSGGKHPRVFPAREEAARQERYRQAVRGNHLVVTLPTPRSVQTVGGPVEVLEIVIGLNRPQYASSLHTITSRGRVLEHGKYPGNVGIELIEAVKALTGGR